MSQEVRAGKAFVEITVRDELQAGLNRTAARLRPFATVTSGIGACIRSPVGSRESTAGDN